MDKSSAVYLEKPVREECLCRLGVAKAAKAFL